MNSQHLACRISGRALIAAEPAGSHLCDGQRPRDDRAAACNLAERCDPSGDGVDHAIVG